MHKLFQALLSITLLAACSSAPPISAPPSPPPATSAATPPVATVPAPGTAAPTTPPQPTPGSAAAPAADRVDDLLVAPATRDQIALAAALGRRSVAEPTPAAPPVYNVGDVQTFWVSDPVASRYYTVTAALRYAGPVVLLYVDTSVNVAQAAVERSARTFEEQIYPRNHALFGTERSPGVDGDPRLTILNTRLRGVLGYYSSADGVPRTVNRFSNERDMFVMALNGLALGSDDYASTLAHEFQHMIHQNQQPRSPLWFNEGMSKVAEDLNGFVGDGVAEDYLRDPNVGLLGWKALGGSIPHYGAAQLFLRYVQHHYGGESLIPELIRRDAGNQPEVFAEIARRTHPDVTDFADLVADWAVANVVDSPAVGDGRFAYPTLPQQIAPLDVADAQRGELEQFGVRAVALPEGPATLRFTGAVTVPLAAVPPFSGRYAWWSNRGDESVSTLTRPVDLRGVQRATLTFQAWHEIEKDYDYAYASVSVDGGQTWQTLKTTTSTDTDPQGANFGNGLTGVSGAPEIDAGKGTRGRWVAEQADLTPYAGREVLLRFWMTQDAGLNYTGLLLDDLSIPELGWRDDVEAGAADWQTVGFVRTTTVLPQRWELRLLRTSAGQTTVEPVTLDAGGQADLTLNPGERGVLVIVPVTRVTDELARYTLEQGKS